jgi:hypothetical protein
MGWTELFARASDSVALSQWLLDRALAALEAARNGALDAVIAAELPSPAGLCEALDSHRVNVPNEVLVKFYGHSNPRPARELDSDSGMRWQAE